MMKILFAMLTGGIGISILFTISCANFDSRSDGNTAENVRVLRSRKTPVILDGRIMNETGWYVPQTRDTKIGTRNIKLIGSTDGNPIKVKITFYTPNNDVFFKEDLFSEGVTRLHGELVLSSFEEYRANNKVYLYSIVAKKNENESQRNVNDHNDKLIYQILDSDGDGVFETLVDNDATILVPKWVIR